MAFSLLSKEMENLRNPVVRKLKQNQQQVVQLVNPIQQLLAQRRVELAYSLQNRPRWKRVKLAQTPVNVP
jgi:hypothetical protein